jgi:hypothetical protein
MLPIVQLFVCELILWPLRPLITYELRESARAYGILPDIPDKTSARPEGDRAAKPPQQIVPTREGELRNGVEFEAREWAVAALNLPGGFLDLSYGG